MSLGFGMHDSVYDFWLHLRLQHYHSSEQDNKFEDNSALLLLFLAQSLVIN